MHSQSIQRRGQLSAWLIPGVVGGVLLTAAAVKAQAILTEGFVASGLFGSTPFQVVLLSLELACGLALWFELWPRFVRGVALALFAAFLATALSQAVAGHRSCSCFGRVEFHPWLAVFVDILVLGLLLCWKPRMLDLAETRGKYFWPVVIILAASALSLWAHSAFFERPVANGGLVVEARDLDRGHVWEDTEVSWPFSVYNPTENGITISGFSADCGCVVAIEPESLRIAAGATARVRMTVDVRNPALTSTRRVPFMVHITPHIANATQTKAWRFTAEIERFLNVTPSEFDLTQVYVVGAPFAPQKATITAPEPVAKVVAQAPRDLASVSVRAIGTSKREWELEFALAPTMSAGVRRFNLELTAERSPDGGRSRTLIPVRAVVQENVQALPPAILLGIQPIGKVLDQTVELYSLLDTPFAVESTSTDSSIRIEHLASEDGRHRYRLTTTITDPGDATRNAVFDVSVKNQQRVRVTIPIAYHGLSRLDAKVSNRQK